MPSKMFVRMVCVALASVLLTAGAVAAQPFDKRTYFSFNAPVAIPGVTLPAGQYLFRMPESYARNVAQVLSADGKTAYAMFFVYHVQRMEAPNQPEITFMETAFDMPNAVQIWWYPGERTGYEFVYPKEQAARLAKGFGHPVLTTEDLVAPEITPDVSLVLPSGEEAVIAEREAPSPAVTLGGELAPQALPVGEPAATLPATASQTPRVALIGLVLLAGLALRRSLHAARG